MRLVRQIFKRIVLTISLCCMFPFAAIAAFGRISSIFKLFAHVVALAPGIVGDYLRIAYYMMTLHACSAGARISFGSFFAQSSVRIADGVYIGAYCVIASCSIGERTHIASHVQLFSGGRQHGRDNSGRLLGADEKSFSSVQVGRDCWIGASAVVMADIGDGSTVGAGSVVPKPIPCGVVAVGNPAKVIRELQRP